MALSLLPLLVAGAMANLPPGTAWTVERTYKYVDIAGSALATQLERIDYKVAEADRNGTTVTVKCQVYLPQTGTNVGTNRTEAETRNYKIRLGVGGASTYKEGPGDSNRARIDRIMWTAAENRLGVSWSRTFPGTAATPQGTVFVKPQVVTPGRVQSESVSYAEKSDNVRGSGAISISLPERIPGAMNLSLTGMSSKVAPDAVKIQVTQKLVTKK